MSPEERAQLIAGEAYTDPGVVFGSTLRIAAQSWQDVTEPGEAEIAMAACLHDVYQQTAVLARRVILLEGQLALLWGIVGSEL